MGFKDKDFKARVVPQSLALFRKGPVIVGHAVVQEPIREVDPPVHERTERGIPMIHYHDIVFNPQSVRVYSEALPVKALEDWTGRRLYPNFYAILGTRRDCERAFLDRRTSSSDKEDQWQDTGQKFADLRIEVRGSRGRLVKHTGEVVIEYDLNERKHFVLW